jgi:hypothetical protein
MSEAKRKEVIFRRHSTGSVSKLVVEFEAIMQGLETLARNETCV